MKNSTQILARYTQGKLTLEEANAQLGATDSGLYLDPDKNKITAAERAQTTIGETPAEANGWGLLDTGLGNPQKQKAEHGVIPTDVGDMSALFFIAGKMYHVQGAALTD